MIDKLATFPFDRDRDQERGRLAAERAKAQGKTPLECALARIESTFSSALHYSHHKQLVRRMMRNGPDAIPLMRYVVVARQVPYSISLHEAVRLVEWCFQMELRRRVVGLTWGRSRQSRLHLMVLDELRLMLRWCRRFAPDEFPSWLEKLSGN